MSAKEKPIVHELRKETLVFTDISTIKVHRVINTPMRICDLLEHVAGDFELRDTVFLGGERTAVSIVHFRPHELINFGEILHRVIGGPLKARGNGR